MCINIKLVGNKICNMKATVIILILGTLVSNLDGTLQCPKLVDLKHHSIVVSCTTPDGNISSCSSEMPIGTTVNYKCDKDKQFRFRSQHESYNYNYNNFLVQCNNNSQWTNYDNLRSLQCVQECGPIISDSLQLWELYIKNKMDNHSQECLGTLIPALSSKSLSFIITSKKCVCKPNDGPVLDTKDLVVALPKRPYTQTIEFKVKSIHMPPTGEDIVLVRLADKLIINPSLKPICLPFDLTPQFHPKHNPLPKHGKVLAFGNSTTVEVTPCSAFDQYSESHEYCADTKSQHPRGCSYPIYGPFVTEGPSSLYDPNLNVSTLHGIYSSHLTRDDCKSGYLFTGIAVSSMADWIRNTVHGEEGSSEHKNPPRVHPHPTRSPTHHKPTGQHTFRPFASSTSTYDVYTTRRTHSQDSRHTTARSSPSTTAYSQTQQIDRNRLTTPSGQERTSQRPKTSRPPSTVRQTRYPTSTTNGYAPEFHRSRDLSEVTYSTEDTHLSPRISSDREYGRETEN